MDYAKEFDEIPNMLGYFNQDYAYTYNWKGNIPTFSPLLRFFKTNNDSKRVEQMINQIEKLLSLGLNNEELKKVMLEEINVEYAMDDYKIFLEESLEILKEPMKKTENEFIPEFIG